MIKDNLKEHKEFNNFIEDFIQDTIKQIMEKNSNGRKKYNLKNI